MNLDELRTVQSKERSKDSLQHLRESFYEEVGDYIADLKEQRERAAERAADQFDDPEVNRLTDEIHTAEDVVEAVYERRVGKVVKRASLAAAGMPADDEGLTGEEQELFSELVAKIEANKSEVLDVLAGESSSSVAGSTPPTDSEPGDAPEPSADVSAADVMGGDASGDPAADASAPTDAESSPAGPDAGDDRGAAEAAAVAGADAPEDGAGPTAAETGDPDAADESENEDPLAGLDERTTVRITRDVGEIFGVDERTYDLEREDVVTLPDENAGPLVERGAAEKLE